jgi:glycerol-3-phosphate dehydrogenase subunit C
LGGHHIAQGFEANGQPVPPLMHPISLIAKAYGLK